jgi:uncharacterized membrane protein (UPF0182 family)
MTSPLPPFVRELRLPPRRSTRWLRITAIVLAAVIAVGLPVAARLADWLWYREVGFERVFLTKVAAQWALGLAAGLCGFLLTYVNGRIALRGVATRNLHIRDASEWAASGPKILLERVATWFVLPITLFIGLVLALASASQWRELAQFFYRTPFGVTDPVFGRDVMYYVFTIPMVENVLTFVNASLWLALLLSLGVYLMRGELGAVIGDAQRPWRFYITPKTQLHVASLAAALLIVGALRVWLVHLPSLLLARHSVLFGATYTDLQVRLPMFRLLAILMVLGAIALIWQARKGQLARTAVVVLASIVGATFLLGGAIPALYQRLVVQPNELARETPQIRHHITATRRAWGLDGVEQRELNAEGQQLTLRDVEANQATIRNVRLWDREPLLQTYGQIQSIRTYYDFQSVDDDRYVINGELRQVLLSPRELNTSALPTRTFINEHLTYTHGMGVTLGPSNQVTAEGLPVLWIKDLPPASSIPLRITRPQIYFGELSNDFILAPSQQREFDFPSGQGDAAVYSTYDGGAGVSVGSFWRRVLFAFRFRSMNIVLSGDVTDNTRILFHRDVIERARLALPFLLFDPDPYMVITNDGRLEWIIDAYTVSDRYPYAQPLANGINYMRNSVKVTVDAYTGAIRAYLADPNDPMIRTLARIYPGMLRPMSEMPTDLGAHVRYPGTLFGAQSSLYATFHMTDPETFYHREDQWQIPVPARSARENVQDGDEFMRHIVMRLPGERAPEFILMRPFTPRQKDNLAAWMVVRNDGEHYGKLRVYSFPRQSLVFGPAQIVNRINQDTEVARQISLWDQRGSEVIRGELLVLPIEESLIYVQPLYLRAQGGRIPELKRVIVAHESRVAMDSTLELGLARLFGASQTLAASATPETSSEAAAQPSDARTSRAPAGTATDAQRAQLIRDANAAYERARAAQRADDWATYGTEMRRLGDLLRRLSRP